MLFQSLSYTKNVEALKNATAYARAGCVKPAWLVEPKYQTLT